MSTATSKLEDPIKQLQNIISNKRMLPGLHLHIIYKMQQFLYKLAAGMHLGQTCHLKTINI